MLVARFLTPVPLGDLVDVLDAGHHRLTGESLTPDAYAIAAAQLQLEHGTGTVNGVPSLRGVFDENLGNHDDDEPTVDERPGSPVTVFQTVPEHEVGAGGKPYQAVHLREAYPDAIEGARGYWQALRDDFSAAYGAIGDGDLVAFVHALKLRHYFTASEADYLRGMQGMVASWRTRIAAAGAV
jgi:hypothetical protein